MPEHLQHPPREEIKRFALELLNTAKNGLSWELIHAAVFSHYLQEKEPFRVRNLLFTPHFSTTYSTDILISQIVAEVLGGMKEVLIQINEESKQEGFVLTVEGQTKITSFQQEEKQILFPTIKAISQQLKNPVRFLQENYYHYLELDQLWYGEINN